jgi:hypothetical protein
LLVAFFFQKKSINFAICDFQGVLNDGNVVCIKTFLKSPGLSWQHSYDIHLLISKLQHKNVVKIVGYVAHEVQSPPFSWVPWVFKWKEAKEHQVITEPRWPRGPPPREVRESPASSLALAGVDLPE